MFSNRVQFALILCTAAISSACSKSVDVDSAKASSSSLTSATDPDRTSCDPFETAIAISSRNGLEASLSYIPNGNTGMYSDIESFFAVATPLPHKAYFSKLNIRTRSYTLGIPTLNGDVVRDAQGNALTQFVGLKLRTKIKLTPLDQPGLKQFAILTDDGAIVRVDDPRTNVGFKQLIRTAGDTPTQLGCGEEVVFMDHFNDYPLEIDYYQGPKNHIAAILLWREIPDQDGDGEIDFGIDGNPIATLEDPACGKSGNDYFFNSAAVPATPKQPWIDLRNRGWEVVPARNFILPDADSKNPCVGQFTS